MLKTSTCKYTNAKNQLPQNSYKNTNTYMITRKTNAERFFYNFIFPV